MRILVAIPHYFDLSREGVGQGRHGSLMGVAGPRIRAFTQCVSALHQLFGDSQVMIDIAARRANPANSSLRAEKLDIIVCTTRGQHLLARTQLDQTAFIHHPTGAEPKLLGFECHAALYERIGDYDYYCYLEDDLILHDPWFFAKQVWFQDQVSTRAVLMPNRYEVSREGPARKAYIDGELRSELTSAFQNIADVPVLKGACLGKELLFRRPTNPHAGCFFLTGDQLRFWAARDEFMDRKTGFIGPLESAATLGVMRHFRVYKPAAEVAGFLEIEHDGTAFIGQLKRGNAIAP